MKAINNKRVLTLTAVMQQFSISKWTLFSLIEDGVLEKITVPGSRRVYISVRSVEKLIGKREAATFLRNVAAMRRWQKDSEEFPTSDTMSQIRKEYENDVDKMLNKYFNP